MEKTFISRILKIFKFLCTKSVDWLRTFVEFRTENVQKKWFDEILVSSEKQSQMFASDNKMTVFPRNFWKTSLQIEPMI